MYYGADYYPEHWPRDRWAVDAQLMREAGITVVRMAEFAWALLEPAPEEYDFAWLDEAVSLLGEHGIKTILGTPTATPPAWLCETYPEILLVDRDRRRMTFGMRRQYCPTSPTYRMLSERIVRGMAEHYRDNPYVVAWQIDNEFGGHWPRCYCSECARAFQAWVRQRYGSLGRLNDAWGTSFWSHTYSEWEQILLPWSTTGTSNPCLELDFCRYSSDQWVAYQQAQLDVLRDLCPQHRVTTNLMGFWFQELNYHDLARNLDLVAWDNYPIGHAHDPAAIALNHATMRGLKDMPFWVMEQQSGPSGWQTMSRAPKPGEIRLWAYQGIAHGADAMVYFRWRTCRFNTEEYWHGILDHHGQPGRRYYEVQAMGRELQRLGDRLVGATTPKAVAMLLSYDDAFAFRLQPNAPGFDYQELFLSIYRALHRLGLAVDVVPPDADLTPYRLVVAPTLHVLPDAWAERLSAYVKQGGHLVLGARSGVKDVSNRVVDIPLPGLLREITGSQVQEYDAIGRQGRNAIRFEPGFLGGDEHTHTVHTWCDILDPRDSDVLARYVEGYYASEPAITRQPVGDGSVIYVGTMGDTDLYHALFSRLMRELALEPLLVAPDGIEVAVRHRDDLRYLFVLNHSDEMRTVELPHPCIDLLSERRYEKSMMLPPRDVAILLSA